MPSLLLSLQPPLLSSHLGASLPLQHRNLGFLKQKLGSSHVRVGDWAAVRFSTNLPLPDPESGRDLVPELVRRAESILYTIADAAASSPDAPDAVKSNRDWLSGITDYLETVLKVLKGGLSALHVPYAYGFAIILLTVLVKAVTFPLSKKQVESAIAMRSLQPQIKAIQQRYAGDQERIQLETARLYKLAGVNPLAGCLPTLVTIPVWIGLYRALSNVADEGLLMEGFFWIPSLSGPTTIAARQSGSGISWLFPFVDGHPPLGWSNTFAYLVLPALLVISQYISILIMQSSQGNDPNQKGSQALTKLLPLMIGYFALSVPSGLSLYWLTNNILSTGQQIWLQKLGGAKNPVRQYSDTSVRTEQPQMQKPTLNVDANKLEPSQTEKSVPGELRPGERFKQLKEQEARRKRQREEEKRKAEAAAKGTEVGNAGHTEEAEFHKIKGNMDTEFTAVEDEPVQSSIGIHDCTDADTPPGNASQSTQDSKEDQSEVGVSEKKNDRVTCNGSIVMKDEQNSHETL